MLSRRRSDFLLLLRERGIVGLIWILDSHEHGSHCEGLQSLINATSHARYDVVVWSEWALTLMTPSSKCTLCALIPLS